MNQKTFTPLSSYPFNRKVLLQRPVLKWKYTLPISMLVLAILFLIASTSHAQTGKKRLFDSEEVFDITLSFDRKAVMKDRGDDPQYHNAVLSYLQDGETMEIPLRIRTRGNFRKDPQNCTYPPLFVNFKKSKTPKNSVFKGQDKTKLVTPCRGDQFVVQEYLVYKLHNLFTDYSFRARLVRVTYHDNVKDKSSDPLYGIFLEEEEQLEKRHDRKTIEKKGFDPKATNRNHFLDMAVFQYLIGNTDRSIQYQQNIKLLADDQNSAPITVPYDFDHAGIVRAPYANPAPELKMTSTLQRRYRGYCERDMDAFSPVFEKFNAKKEEVMAVYRDNELLSKGFKKQTLKWLEDFFTTINDPKKAEKAFMYPCDPNGTGNVIIKGLNAD